MHQLKTAIIAFLLTIAIAVPVTGETGENGQTEQSGQNQQLERSDQRKRDMACSCCKQCQAARKDVRGKEEGPPAKNGCKDCCKRCGHLPDPKTMPPEVVK